MSCSSQRLLHNPSELSGTASSLHADEPATVTLEKVSEKVLNSTTVSPSPSVEKMRRGDSGALAYTTSSSPLAYYPNKTREGGTPDPHALHRQQEDDSSSCGTLEQSNPLAPPITKNNNWVASNGSAASCGVEDADTNVFDWARREKTVSLESSSSKSRRSRTHGGCCLQLGATMHRVLVLMSREWLSSLCEFLIPTVFIVGSVILWVIFGRSSQGAQNYYDPSSVDQITTALGQLRQASCYNESIGVIPGLAPCSSLNLQSLYCPKGRGIPPGFCYWNALKQAVLAIGLLVESRPCPLFSFDEIVLIHWCNLDEAYLSRGSTGGGDALTSGGLLYFSPDSPATRDLIDYFNTTSSFFNVVYGGVFSTTAAAEDHVRQRNEFSAPNWGIIQVNSLTPESFDVAIRLNSSALPSTGTSVSKYYVGGIESNGNDLYLLSGFLTLQTMVYKFYMQDVLQLRAPDDFIDYVPMPTAAFKAQDFIVYGGQLAPLIMVLGFLYPVSQLTKRVVVEKELRMREALLIMGLSEVIMYLAWFLIYLVEYIVTSLIIAIILQFTYLPNTNFGYIFFMFFFFSISTVTLSGAIAAVFSAARLAAILAPLIYFVLAIPLFAMQSAGPSAQTGIMILSPSALAVGINLLFQHEVRGGSDARALTYFRDDPNLMAVYAFLFCDILVYLLLMVYFDQVIPKQWGTTKNPLFFIIDPIKWCFCRKSDDDEDIADGRAPNGVFEPVKDEEQAAVRLVGLRKKYSRGGKTFIAVNNLFWSMKEGEISVLLGHNGAGKSTTMNLMTGMVEPSAGDCIIYGKSIRHNLRAARQEIGLCPQHNILWPHLTCREHLEYYAAIKGLRHEEKETAVMRLLRAVDLENKEDYTSKDLSGGQKRKLSVAVAFVGGSRLIFLDEPTAGMDVGARRHTWGLLKEMAKYHTILLTTHFMDEADLLGNTIAIMSEGRLQCSGSSMFLKSKLGVGFLLTMSVKAHIKREPIDSLLHESIPAAEPIGSGAGEIAYRLPMGSKQTFPTLLKEIEDRSSSLGINAYSLSATTLEEVFLRSAENDAKTTVAVTNSEEVANSVWDVQLMEGGWHLRMCQFRAMIIKRFWNALRDRRTQFFQIVCPVACVLLAMLLMLVKFQKSPTIDLNSNFYGTKVEVPVANCDGFLDTSQPFSSNAETIVWNDVTSGSAFSQKLLDTYNEHDEERYSGIMCNGTTTPTLQRTYSDLFYNYSALHEVAIVTANFYNSHLWYALGSAQKVMVTKVETMPLTNQEEAVSNSLYAMIIAIIIMIPFSFIPSTFVGWIVKERECKARHLQNVSGLSFYVYWASNFIFDLASYIVTMFLVIAVFGIFQRKEYIARENIGATIILFFLYGISGILMAYAISFLFKEHSSAQNVVMLANFIVGFLLVLAVSAFSLIDSTKEAGRVLRYIFRVVPSYCVGEGISNLATLQMQRAYGFHANAWAMKVTGWPCVYMAIEIPVLLFITLFVDHPERRQRSQRLFHDPNAPAEVIEGEDPDVVDEREAVLHSAEREGDLVRVRQLRKVYSNGKVAVRNVTFGVKPGEVFGFLGTNGAGKTTTISILCQEFYPTSGHAAICGHDIVEESRAALRCIGYCPQFDACLDLLTVEEHLYLYAGVRGIVSSSREGAVEGLLRLCELVNYRKTVSHELSGGNRRKLSVALSLIGGPRVVFLDEPSAGMDPVARRGLWSAIETVADNCSVVLTTHHLEEVEALAHRVAIMVDGTLRCIGDKTHLKQKYGTGFEVNIVPRQDSPGALHRVQEFFHEVFPSAKLVENHSGRLTYNIPNTIKLSKVFALLEENAAKLQINDYNVSQTSIEQVFMRISEEAEAKEEEELRIKAEQAKQKKEKRYCVCCC